MKYQVFQIVITREISDSINRGHKSEIYTAYLDTMVRGSDGYDEETHTPFYTHVADVEAVDLEDAFCIMNAWDCPEAVERLAPCHSLSVGDILVSGETAYIVDSCGYTQIAFQA